MVTVAGGGCFVGKRYPLTIYRLTETSNKYNPQIAEFVSNIDMRSSIRPPPPATMGRVAVVVQIYRKTVMSSPEKPIYNREIYY
jgi:hypothetical protein